jgi:hypothetical protein
VKTCPATTSSIATIPPIPSTQFGCTDGDVYVERNRRLEMVASSSRR